MPSFIKKKPSPEDFNVELSKEDIRNGWTQEKMKSYLAERAAQKQDFDKTQNKIQRVKVEGVTGYDPHKHWR